MSSMNNKARTEQQKNKTKTKKKIQNTPINKYVTTTTTATK